MSITEETHSITELTQSKIVAPIVLAMYIYTQPESPRWLLGKAGKALKANQTQKAKQYYNEAFHSLTKLRHSKLQAARDMLFIYYSLRKEQELFDRGTEWVQRVLDLFRVRRNRRAVIASLIVMFFQQFCGINVLIYYSSTVLTTAGYLPQQALYVSGPNEVPRNEYAKVANSFLLTVVHGRRHHQLFLRYPRLPNDRYLWEERPITRYVSVLGSVSATECDRFQTGQWAR